ncbi:MAG: DUF3793 family protein [Candidatus Limiplasma sp.]|nr:DUF3793 family protein [Candidatus Limiplasma sp.]
MKNNFEQLMVQHCAATLAGHKCGSLFAFCTENEREWRQAVDALDALLAPKGVRVRALASCPRGCKVYAYRPAMLARRLEDPQITRFLAQKGYTDMHQEECLNELGRRIQCEKSFPHEIGVFLDYPLEDVIGFIEHGGRHCACAGCWKAYSDEREAKRRFELYGKCKRVYTDCYHRGTDVARLTVAV